MLKRIRRLLSRRRPDPFLELPDIAIRPIGIVRNDIEVPQAAGFDWQQVTSRIVVRPELADALLGLDTYSHVIVLFWPHLVPEDVRGSKRRLHPMDDPQNPLQGILATRSQIRFNPILTTAVPLLGIKKNIVRVKGLDAVNGSPVLDLKPYNPYFDAVVEGKVPGWLAEAAERRRAVSEK